MTARSASTPSPNYDVHDQHRMHSSAISTVQSAQLNHANRHSTGTARSAPHDLASTVTGIAARPAQCALSPPSPSLTVTHQNSPIKTPTQDAQHDLSQPISTAQSAQLDHCQSAQHNQHCTIEHTTVSARSNVRVARASASNHAVWSSATALDGQLGRAGHRWSIRRNLDVQMSGRAAPFSWRRV
jgi:hypothetical protein